MLNQVSSQWRFFSKAQSENRPQGDDAEVGAENRFVARFNAQRWTRRRMNHKPSAREQGESRRARLGQLPDAGPALDEWHEPLDGKHEFRCGHADVHVRIQKVCAQAHPRSDDHRAGVEPVLEMKRDAEAGLAVAKHDARRDATMKSGVVASDARSMGVGLRHALLPSCRWIGLLSLTRRWLRRGSGRWNEGNRENKRQRGGRPSTERRRCEYYQPLHGRRRECRL